MTEAEDMSVMSNPEAALKPGCIEIIFGTETNLQFSRPLRSICISHQLVFTCVVLILTVPCLRGLNISNRPGPVL